MYHILLKKSFFIDSCTCPLKTGLRLNWVFCSLLHRSPLHFIIFLHIHSLCEIFISMNNLRSLIIIYYKYILKITNMIEATWIFHILFACLYIFSYMLSKWDLECYKMFCTYITVLYKRVVCLIYVVFHFFLTIHEFSKQISIFAFLKRYVFFNIKYGYWMIFFV